MGLRTSQNHLARDQGQTPTPPSRGLGPRRHWRVVSSPGARNAQSQRPQDRGPIFLERVPKATSHAPRPTRLWHLGPRDRWAPHQQRARQPPGPTPTTAPALPGGPPFPTGTARTARLAWRPSTGRSHWGTASHSGGLRRRSGHLRTRGRRSPGPPSGQTAVAAGLPR